MYGLSPALGNRKFQADGCKARSKIVECFYG